MLYHTFLLIKLALIISRKHSLFVYFSPPTLLCQPDIKVVRYSLQFLSNFIKSLRTISYGNSDSERNVSDISLSIISE
jgi:hypothetical protein